jgi:hypothetical protein
LSASHPPLGAQAQAGANAPLLRGLPAFRFPAATIGLSLRDQWHASTRTRPGRIVGEAHSED